MNIQTESMEESPSLLNGIQPLSSQLKEILAKIALAIRILSMDAVQRADSGHPGLPMGCAELGAYLFGYALRYNPENPSWSNRDRFILSAGHGSMLLYSCLYLAGYDLSLEDIKNFRQLHSKTPGHPECMETPGVETTTGPLGQGLGNAVGQALAMKILADKFNTPSHSIIDNKIFCLVGDGCIMEGVTSEVSSLAGHLKLNNLIVIYDANSVTLDGALSESCSENTKERYLAYGWDVLEIDGANFDAIHEAISTAKNDQQRPCLIIARTIIGKGSPNKAGTYKAHGAPLGEEEIKATKAALGAPEEPFYVPQAVYDFFKRKIPNDIAQEVHWQNELFDPWCRAHPTLFEEWETMAHKVLPSDLEEKLYALPVKNPISSRASSQIMLNALGKLLPQLYGGSADLSGSDCTMMKEFPLIGPNNFSGRNIKYGVREFGMATMATGLTESGMITPFIGTFLTFSDYMRNAIRLAALMQKQVIYHFTHDSIFLGEDGPTHQPIEHLAALRAIPRLQVIRPADAHEVAMAWIAALQYSGPTALILSRQNLPTLESTKVPFAEGVASGGYIVKREQGEIAYTLLATGSEVALALNVAAELEKVGKATRVVSMPCFALFDKQNTEYRNSVIGNKGLFVSIESGVEQGWHKYIGKDGMAICMESFGASAPQRALAEEFGFTVESILERIL
jgi:transketolase